MNTQNIKNKIRKGNIWLLWVGSRAYGAPWGRQDPLHHKQWSRIMNSGHWLLVSFLCSALSLMTSPWLTRHPETWFSWKLIPTYRRELGWLEQEQRRHKGTFITRRGNRSNGIKSSEHSVTEPGCWARECPPCRDMPSNCFHTIWDIEVISSSKWG